MLHFWIGVCIISRQNVKLNYMHQNVKPPLNELTIAAAIQLTANVLQTHKTKASYLVLFAFQLACCYKLSVYRVFSSPLGPQSLLRCTTQCAVLITPHN